MGEGEATQDRSEDAALVERFLRGDTKAAFERIVALHMPYVRRLAHRLTGWRGECDDVAQDVFVVAWERLHQLQTRDNLRGWLTTITIHRCRRQQRGWLSRWRTLISRASQKPAEAAPPADESLAEREQSQRVVEATGSLTPAEREVVVLHYLEQRSTAEVSEVLGVSIGAVEVRLHRARQHLRGLLEANEPARMERKT